MRPEVQLLLPTRSLLGEGPVWDARGQLLYWVDIHGKWIHSFCPVQGEHRQWSLPVRPSALAVCTELDRLVVAAEHGLGFFSPSSGEWTPWLELEDRAQWPLNRTNDGRCAPDGSFWVGTMHDEVAGRTGSLYRIEGSGRVDRVVTDLGIPNTLAWTNERFYFGDSLDRRVMSFPWGGALELGEPSDFVVLPEGPACPDGSALDSEGRLWTCVWDGGRVECRSPAGDLIQEVHLPVQRPTSCAFGGANLDRLFVTSSGQDLPEPNGALFVIDGAAKGREEARFLSA